MSFSNPSCRTPSVGATEVDSAVLLPGPLQAVRASAAVAAAAVSHLDLRRWLRLGEVVLI
jgi:hypothetical protein